MPPDNLHILKVFEHLESALNTKASRLCEYGGDGRDRLSIMEVDDHPQAGVRTYSTVGLSRYPLMRDGKAIGLGVEFIGSCGSAFPDFNGLISALAFQVMFSKWYCCPGMIYPDMATRFSKSVTMSDIYFANPFLWDDKLFGLKIEDLPITWLLAVPISRTESDYARKFGTAALEDLFEKQDIDIFNLNRPSIV